MMLASRVTCPSRSGLAPKPTQQLIDDSVIFTPASTASSALPPRPSTSQAPLLASLPVSQVEMTTGFPVTIQLSEWRAAATAAVLPSNSPSELINEDCKNFRRLDMIT